MKHPGNLAKRDLRIAHHDADRGPTSGPGQRLRHQGGTGRRLAVIGEIGWGNEEAEGIWPRSIERGQSVQHYITIALQPATHEIGDGPGSERRGNRITQGFALILSMTFWVISSDLSAVTIRPSLALTSKIIAYPSEARIPSMASFTLV